MAFGFGRKKKASGVERTPAQVAQILENFLNNTGPKWEWDDFTATPLTDPELERIRDHCKRLDLEFPPEKPGEFTNEMGRGVVRGYLEQVRAAAPAASTK